MMNVLVCFTGSADNGLWRYLRQGFRHCAICLRTERRWIVLDPLSDHLNIGLAEDIDPFSLAAGLAAAGAGVVCLPNPVLAPAVAKDVRPLTCVEIVKRALGFRANRVCTPWQLYRCLVSTPLDGDKV